MQITTDDRDPLTGRIMVEAEQRARARETPPEVPPPDPGPTRAGAGEPIRTRKFSNRRGQADPARPATSYKSAIGPIVGILAFTILLALGARLLPGTAPLADRSVPTAMQQQPSAAAPAVVPTTAPSATPEPPTATPEPPTQTPAVVYVEVAPPCDVAVNPLYSVQLDVYADGGRPIGIARGVSCDSQADAEANAAAIATEMKKGAKP